MWQRHFDLSHSTKTGVAVFKVMGRCHCVHYCPLGCGAVLSWKHKDVSEVPAPPSSTSLWINLSCFCREQGSLKCRYSYQTSWRHIPEYSSVFNQHPDSLKFHSVTLRLREGKIKVLKMFLKTDGFYSKPECFYKYKGTNFNCSYLVTVCSVINVQEQFLSAINRSRITHSVYWLDYGLNNRGVFCFSAGGTHFSVLCSERNGSTAHLACYCLGTEGALPGGKTAGAWNWSLTSI